MRLRQLYELEVKPGERKGFSLSMKKLEAIQLKVAEMQSAISKLKNTNVPDVLKQQMEELINSANIEKEKLYSDLLDNKAPEIVEGIPANVLKLFKGIDKNCSTIMNAYRQTDSFLYRGIKSEDDALYGKPFETRQPKDSNRELNDILNNALASQGFSARRDNTSFTSGDYNQAGNYGHNVYIFIPKNGFKFHYSEKIRDLVLGYDKLDMLLDPDKVSAAKKIIENNWESLKKYFDHRYNANELFYGYEVESDFKGLKRAAEEGALPAEMSDIQSLQDLVSDEKIIDNFKYNQTDLESAIKSRHEVMVTGPYYAIKRNKYEALLKKYLDLTKRGIDLTPDSEKERKQLSKKISSALGTTAPAFEQGDYVTHKIEKIMGEVVNNFYTNDFVQIKNYDGELVLAKKSNLKKINADSTETFEEGDKVLFKTENTMFEYLSGKRGEVVSSDTYSVTVKYKKHYDFETITLPKMMIAKAKKYDSDYPEVDDIAKVLAGHYAGEYGKITYVSSYNSIDLALIGHDESISLDKGDFEIVDPKDVPPEPESPFVKGDFVQITDDAKKYKGYVGTVISTTGYNSKVRILNRGQFSKQTILNSKLKKISQDYYDSRIFDYNSEVVVVSGKHKGLVANVTYLSPSGIIELQDNNGNFYDNIKPTELVLKSAYRGELPQVKKEPASRPNVDLDSDDQIIDVDFEPLDDDTPKVGTNGLKFKEGDMVNASNPKITKPTKWMVKEITKEKIELVNVNTGEMIEVSYKRFYKANPKLAPDNYDPSTMANLPGENDFSANAKDTDNRNTLSPYKPGNKVSVKTGPFRDHTVLLLEPLGKDQFKAAITILGSKEIININKSDLGQLV